LIAKIEAYSHQEINTGDVKMRLESRIAANQDFIGRRFHLKVDSSDLPGYLLNNLSKYREFLRR
jgi:hypothetical protein